MKEKLEAHVLDGKEIVFHFSSIKPNEKNSFYKII